MRRLIKLSAKHASENRHYPRLYERLVPIVIAVLIMLVVAVFTIITLVLAGVIGR